MSERPAMIPIAIVHFSPRRRRTLTGRRIILCGVFTEARQRRMTTTPTARRVACRRCLKALARASG